MDVVIAQDHSSATRQKLLSGVRKCSRSPTTQGLIKYTCSTHDSGIYMYVQPQCCLAGSRGGVCYLKGSQIHQASAKSTQVMPFELPIWKHSFSSYQISEGLFQAGISL